LEVLEYEIARGWQAAITAAVLPGLEIGIGLGLLAATMARSAAWLSSALLLVFGCAQVSAMVRGLEIGCGCFGRASDADSELIGSASIIRTVALFVVSAAIALRYRRKS